jgi:hypothetical protein
MCMEDRSSSEVRARSVLSEKDKVNLLVALTGLHSCRIKRRPIARFSSLQNIILAGFQTTTKLCIVISLMFEHATVATIPGLPGSQHTTLFEWYVLLTVFVVLVYSKRIVDFVNEMPRQQE